VKLIARLARFAAAQLVQVDPSFMEPKVPSSTKNATNITLDSEPTKTRSSKQEKKTDDSKETGQFT
jgi:hypothetical protein